MAVVQITIRVPFFLIWEYQAFVVSLRHLHINFRLGFPKSPSKNLENIPLLFRFAACDRGLQVLEQATLDSESIQIHLCDSKSLTKRGGHGRNHSHIPIHMESCAHVTASFDLKRL